MRILYRKVLMIGLITYKINMMNMMNRTKLNFLTGQTLNGPSQCLFCNN